MNHARRENLAIAKRRARTISSGDNTPNCTALTRRSSAVLCGNRSITDIVRRGRGEKGAPPTLRER